MKTFTKNKEHQSLITAAIYFRQWRTKADDLRKQRAVILKACTGSQREFGHAPCPKYWKAGARHKWCDSCLSAEAVNKEFHEAAHKATGWQRALYHWCDTVKKP